MIVNSYGDFFTDAAGFVTSIFSGATRGAGPPPPPPTPWYETGGGLALLGVGALSVAGLGYMAIKKRRAAPIAIYAGYGRRKRRKHSRRSRR